MDIYKPKITIKVEMIDGLWISYPVCDKAKIFAEIAGTETLSEQLISKIESLGYEIFTQSLYMSS